MDYFQQHEHKQCNIYGQISYVVVCNWTVVWGMRSTESRSCTALILLFVCDKRIRTDQLFYHCSFKLRFVSLLLNEHDYDMLCYVLLMVHRHTFLQFRRRYDCVSISIRLQFDRTTTIRRPTTLKTDKNCRHWESRSQRPGQNARTKFHPDIIPPQMLCPSLGAFCSGALCPGASALYPFPIVNAGCGGRRQQVRAENVAT